MTMTDPAAADESVDTEEDLSAFDRIARKALESGELDAQPALEDETRINQMLWVVAYLNRDLARVEKLLAGDYAELAAVHAEELAVLDDRREDLTAGIKKRIEDLSANIENWHRAVYADAEARKARKMPTSVKFPAGAVTSRAGSVTVDFPDKDAEAKVIEWLRANDHEDLVRTTVSVAKTEFKARFLNSDNELRDPNTGHPVPGTKVVIKPRTHDVKPLEV